MNVLIDVQVGGPLIKKNVPQVVKTAIVEETLKKLQARLMRKGPQGSGGRGLGVKRNTITDHFSGLELELDTTLKWPRTRGTAKQNKDAAIVRSYAPRLIRKMQERIANEL